MLALRAPRVRKIGRNIADEGLRIDEVSPNIVVRGRFAVLLLAGAVSCRLRRPGEGLSSSSSRRRPLQLVIPAKAGIQL